MQYLLTQAEYDQLKESAKSVSQRTEEEIQMLCSLVADWMPGRDTNRPVGCILTPGPNHKGICDFCPVEGNCRHPYKRWSK